MQSSYFSGLLETKIFLEMSLKNSKYFKKSAGLEVKRLSTFQ